MKLDKRLIALINSKGGGGTGGDGVSITNCTINDSGNLIVTLSDGTTIDAGHCVGAKGDKGDKGDAGADGTPGTPGTPAWNASPLASILPAVAFTVHFSVGA